MSLTFTLTGHSNRLSADIYPPISLDTDRYEYSVCLIGFNTYNSIPNIEEGHDKFYYTTVTGQHEFVKIPTGSYELHNIEKYLQDVLASDDADEKERNDIISMKPNTNTLQCELRSVFEVDFTFEDSIGPLLGFSRKVLVAGQKHVSDMPVNIIRVNTIRLTCNLTAGSYHNGKQSHILYEFAPMVDPGYALDIEPRNLIYLPLNKNIREIDNITVDILDQDSKPVNLRNEKVVLRLELKRTRVF